jgi:CHAT domain-containing protein
LNTQRSNASAAPLHPNSLKYAQQLYQWLIAPLDDALRNIETLIVVPDGILLHLPFAALHDGKQFLIEKFAVAVSPGLCLTQARLAVDKNNLLLGGLSEEVQGFSALPCAGYELDKLHESAAGNTRTLLLNQDFTRDSFRKSVENHNFDVVHLASHGEFSPQPDKSFILTYDGRLSLNDLGNLARLGELRGRPLDLLTLSACETAKGNDRAALGLAGVTLQSGAVSALASLWKVDDTATPAVVLEFYRQWQNGASKAQALRQAQLKLLQDEQYAAYRHPYYWSAFLLIGNWL